MEKPLPGQEKIAYHLAQSPQVSCYVDAGYKQITTPLRFVYEDVMGSQPGLQRLIAPDTDASAQRRPIPKPAFTEREITYT